MESKRKIMVRYRRGEGIRAISRALNISRNTGGISNISVKRYGFSLIA